MQIAFEANGAGGGLSEWKKIAKAENMTNTHPIFTNVWSRFSGGWASTGISPTIPDSAPTTDTVVINASTPDMDLSSVMSGCGAAA